MRKAARRKDVPVGKVPDYRTFVRHLWSYEDPSGFKIGAPPVLYRAVFEEGEDWLLVRSLVETVLVETGAAESIGFAKLESDHELWELTFGSLEALHRFCTCLAGQAQFDAVAMRIGEFIMWTLGFRWV